MRLCIPVKGKNYVEAALLLNKVEQKATDTFPVEIWLDTLQFKDIKSLIKGARLPVIAVCRGVEEKGDFRSSEEERIEYLCEAARTGAAFLDIGMQMSYSHLKKIKAVCKKTGTKLIISKHFWAKEGSHPSMGTLLKTARLGRKKGADVVKIATTISNYSENVILFELVRRLNEDKIPAIILGMGEKGYLSRLGTPILGGYLTYVALDEKSRTAPGQPLLTDWLLEEFMVK